jgi:hypothetical protein
MNDTEQPDGPYALLRSGPSAGAAAEAKVAELRIALANAVTRLEGWPSLVGVKDELAAALTEGAPDGE